ncbi:MAG TPA: PRC-barrel domain-containing protein [Alphaproteobacteria bacterium]|nr:PRC-barrel domain-containing protein [Alphaproteobacteria bacterium]
MFIRTVLAATAALAIAGTALAQNSTPSSGSSQMNDKMNDQATQGGTMPSGTTDSGFITAQQPGQTLASKLIGTSVTDSSGKNVGEVSDLIVSQDNRVVGAVIEVGGILGIGGHSVAVPLKSLSLQQVQGEPQAMLNISPDALKQAPEFKSMESMKSEQSGGTSKY